jgi:hypothetical protein
MFEICKADKCYPVQWDSGLSQVCKLKKSFTYFNVVPSLEVFSMSAHQMHPYISFVSAQVAVITLSPAVYIDSHASFP